MDFSKIPHWDFSSNLSRNLPRNSSKDIPRNLLVNFLFINQILIRIYLKIIQRISQAILSGILPEFHNEISQVISQVLLLWISLDFSRENPSYRNAFRDVSENSFLPESEKKISRDFSRISSIVFFFRISHSDLSTVSNIFP